jgi:3-oxoadipate enol-lactonase
LPTLSVRGARLGYDVAGPVEVDRPDVVQLHGLTSSRARDALLGLDLARGAVGHRVIRYDARGHGFSSGDEEPRSYRWPALAEDLLALLDVLGTVGSVHGVGQSMGAGTLLHAAVRAPERFTSLVLGIPPTAWDTRAAQRDAYLQTARLVASEGADALVEQATAAPTPPAVDPDLPRTRPAVVDALLPTVFTGAAHTDLPEPDQIATLSMPTLLLAWVDDPAHPLSTAQRLHELMPRSRLVVARTPRDTQTWAAQVAEHLARTADRVP